MAWDRRNISNQRGSKIWIDHIECEIYGVWRMKTDCADGTMIGMAIVIECFADWRNSYSYTHFVYRSQTLCTAMRIFLFFFPFRFDILYCSRTWHTGLNWHNEINTYIFVHVYVSVFFFFFFFHAMYDALHRAPKNLHARSTMCGIRMHIREVCVG